MVHICKLNLLVRHTEEANFELSLNEGVEDPKSNRKKYFCTENRLGHEEAICRDS